MGRKFRNTFFTNEQVEVLRMRAQGLTVEEIAERLKVSRTDVHAVLRNAHQTVERAKETLRTYSRIVGGLTLRISAGTPVVQALNDLFREGDEHGIKVALRSVEILMKIIKEIPNCVDLSREVFLCDVDLHLTTSGEVNVAPR